MPDIFIADKKNKKKEQKPKTPPKKSVKKDHSAKKHRTFKTNPLSSYIYYPREVNFLNKDPEEQVILILRRHPITNLGWAFLGLLMLFAPTVLNYFPIIEFLPERFQFIIIVSWYLLTVAFVFEKFLSWFFNVNIITDERIFDVDFIHLTYREMTDANIDQVQDVTVRMGSVIRTIFNYGDIVIQTAAEIPQIGFEAVPKPDRVARILRELRIEEEKEKLEGRVR